MQEFDKRLSDKVKQELGHYEPEFNPAHWSDMQQKLTAAKRMFWLKIISAIGGIIILGSICAWCFLKIDRNKEFADADTMVIQKDTALNNAESLIKNLDSLQSDNNDGIQRNNASIFEGIQQEINKNNEILEIENKERGITSLSKNQLENSKSHIEENIEIKPETTTSIPKNNRQENNDKNFKLNTSDKSIKEVNNTKNQITNEKQNILLDSGALINANSIVEETKSLELDNQTTTYTNDLLPTDSLKYYQKSDSILIPKPLIVPQKPIENKPTEPASKYELGFLTGVSLLSAELNSTLGLNIDVNLNYYLHKRVFVQAAIGFQGHNLKTNHSAYVPNELPTFADDTLSFSPSVQEESFRQLQYKQSPLAYRLPVYSLTTSIGYHLYQSKKLNVFTSVGLTNYLWGKVTIEPYVESSSARNADYLYISSSLASADIIGDYPVEYSAFSHSDLLGAWKTQWGAQYRINHKLSISSSMWYERSFGEISPVAFKMSRFGFKSGILISLN